MTNGGFSWWQRQMHTFVSSETWGFVFISWQKLKLVILVRVVVQKIESAILLDLSLWHLPNSKE